MREQYFNAMAAYVKKLLPEGVQLEKTAHGARWMYEWDPYEHEYEFSCSLICHITSFEDQSVDYIQKKYGKDIAIHYMKLLPFYVYTKATVEFDPVDMKTIDLFPEIPFENNIKYVSDGFFKRQYICQRIGLDNPYIYENRSKFN